MKNIHVLSTEKPSRLRYNLSNILVLIKDTYRVNYDNEVTQHIYITSDEEIKEGDWQIDSKNRVNKFSSISMNLLGETYQKIILTTDQDLIKAGVQAIDDKFLEWFVENPNCKLIEVKPLLSNNGRVLFGYKIIIPQEEQEQFVECKCTNSLQAENCIRNCGHGKEPKQETQGYICPHTKIQCDDECCVSAENCHIEESLSILSEPEQKYETERMYSEGDIMNALHSVELKDNKDYSKIWNSIKEFLNNLKK